MSYNIYEWEISPKSSFITPLESDIIFGHIIWAMKYLDGEEEVENILDEFKSNQPPFIISNGFYTGYFPFINNQVVKRKDTGDFTEILKQDKELAKEETEEWNIAKLQEITVKALKKIKKIKNIEKDLFYEMLNGYSVKEFISDILGNERDPIDLKKYSEKKYMFKTDINEWVNGNLKLSQHEIRKFPGIKKESIIKNSINRLTSTTDFGADGSGLYSQNEIYYDSKYNLSIFFKLRSDINIKKFEKYLKYIEDCGYGKKKSSGKGYFETIKFEKNDYFTSNTESNAYIVLSNYIPNDKDYEEVFYGDTMVKRGKLGDIKSFSEKPFKKPIIMYKPGSIFKGEMADIKGKMLGNIHFEKDIVQYGYGFTVGVKIHE